MEPSKYIHFFRREGAERAAKFVTAITPVELGWGGGITDILEKLKWKSLKKRKDSQYFTRGLKGAASIPTNDHVSPSRRTKKPHSLGLNPHWLGSSC